MRVTIITGGSRGDVEPYVALGSALRAAGEQVRVLSYAPYEEMTRRQGLEFAELSGDVAYINQRLSEAGRSPIRFARRFREVLEPLIDKNLEETLRACDDADVVVFATVGFLGYIAAEKRGIPVVAASLKPLYDRTSHYPSSVLAPAWSAGSLYNRLSYRLTEQIFWQSFRSVINRLRDERSGLAKLPLFGPFHTPSWRRMPILCGWSPSVLRQPSDVQRRLRVTGYWFGTHPEDWQPTRRLAGFLENGSPPIVVGFGSTNLPHMDEVWESAVEAVKTTRQRAVFLTGWSNFSNEDLPDEILALDEVPHDWLLPRASAFVNHGGAGSVAAGLRAGIPIVTVPFFADQFFWARRVCSLGVGPPPVRGRPPTEGLAAAIGQAVSNSKMRRRATELRCEIRTDNGADQAAAEVRDYTEAWWKG